MIGGNGGVVGNGGMVGARILNRPEPQLHYSELPTVQGVMSSSCQAATGRVFCSSFSFVSRRYNYLSLNLEFVDVK